MRKVPIQPNSTTWMELHSTDASAELSEGELVEEEEESIACGGADAVEEPKSKKIRLQASASDQDGEGWEKPTKKQLKKMAKKKNREKKKYQVQEDQFASTISQQQSASTSLLNTRQTELLESLAKMVHGEQSNVSSIQILKTMQFQQVLSHLVIGSSSPVFPIEGMEDIRQNHKVVVVWLSLVSAEFFRSGPALFPRLKKLTPHVKFDLQHPGSNSYVRLGLESFMMSPDTENQASPSTNPKNVYGRSVDTTPPRWSYLFSLVNLTQNDFPNPSQGDVDQLGRSVRDYISIRDWPNCDIRATEEVIAGKNGVGAKMPMFAIDCEMVGTQSGSELARISIVDENLECIYDTYVKPDCPILDYRTKYSGITESTLEEVTTTLKDVQGKLVDILPSNSILVGHSLENDFHAMKFRHPFVIDTSCLFTPFATPTCKPGLRKLSKELLLTDIQNSDKGHDSIEDAGTCMKLLMLKLKEGASCKISFNDITPSIFTNFRTKGCTTGIVDKESVVQLFGKGSSHSVDVKTDEEAIKRTVEIIPLSKFTFVQLHSMEYLLKSTPQVTKEKQLETANDLDKLVINLVEQCPSNTIVFVVCGSGDIRKVRSLQQQEFSDYRQLKKEVLVARTGCVVGLLVN